jgi:hypothetical protein
MATVTRTATSTAIATATSTALSAATPNSSILRGRIVPEKANGSAPRRPRDTKYRHVFATHSINRTTCLSEDAHESPSFVGFRNLMILVLSTLLLPQPKPLTLADPLSRLQPALNDSEPAKVRRLDLY